MKNTILIIVATLWLGTLSAQVNFESMSTDALRAKAETQGKLVFIDLYATWCQPCRVMDNQVFSREDVGDFMAQHFVCTRYNVDKATGKDLMKQYGAGAIPLYLIFATNGDLLGSITGGSSADEFIENIETILAKQKKSK